MVGNWGFQTIFGFVAFLFTYFFSLSNNTWQTSLFRALIGFLVFFLLGYAARIIFHQIASKKAANIISKESINESNKVNSDVTNEIEGTQAAEPVFQSIPLHALHKNVQANEPD